jgi:hypothetical protein
MTGCMGLSENDRLEVGGVVPSPLHDKPDVIGRDSDAPSVLSLNRANWGEREHVVANHMVAHRPTYARRNTRFDVSARASGRYPTLAEAINLPGGAAESEQIYDAVTWPFLIVPATLLLPFGIVVEPPIATIHDSPQWEYQRRQPGIGERPGPGEVADPFVDRLGLPVVEGPTVVVPDPLNAPAAAPGEAPPNNQDAAGAGSAGGGR